MTTTTYGVLILNEHGQLLLAHATGRKYWDIPKGGAQEGETARAAAVREAQEETGINLSCAALEELGVVRYLPRKNLHLFRTSLHTSECDVARCRCTSFFVHPVSGIRTPEVDRFRWVDLPDIASFAAKSMTTLLRTLPGFEAMNVRVDTATAPANGAR